jgi:glyoxylase-like metal-dependent hydrolase (beta-lactamase superfamily II)
MRALILAAIAAGCAAPRFVPIASPAPEVAIDRIVLRWSNVYLVRDRGAYALVDAGSPVDRDALARALAARGVAPGAIRAVIVTHAHADHAGLARWLQRAGVRVVLGAADARVAARGANDPLPATGLLGGWLAPLFMFPYAPFTPDVAIDRERDLAALGLPDLRVVPVPGHTPGSIAVLVGDVALAGDVMKGGYFAKLDVTRPSEHYYEADLAADHAAVRALLARGAATFLVGHGGPLARADVARWAATADEPSAPRMASLELGVAGELGRAGAPDGLSGVLRARFGLAQPLGYYGGFDLRGGGAGGADLEADADALGLALRTPGGAFLGIAGGLGYRSFAGSGTARIPLELAAELPAGPLHLLARIGLAWQLGGAADPRPAFGNADELTALLGIRLGRDRTWLRVRAGEGPYLAATYRDLDGTRLVGLALGVQLWAGD